MSKKINVIIIGAAGRDFHNFNTYYRDNDLYNVVGFTAAQIPDIDGRKYPAALAGKLYPEGIPIFAESELPVLIKKLGVDECTFSYSDVSYQHVMNISAIVNAAGANFRLLGPKNTQIKSTKPVVAVCAVRTGAGKGQTARRVIEALMAKGLKVVAARHPMPYGDLTKQECMRFATVEDLKKNNCTIEEMEEYEPHVIRGNVIYSGVDYEKILRSMEKDPHGCDVVIWDGGNNDFPFFVTDLLFTIVDPLRPGHELSFYPGEATLRMADVAVINKIDSASLDDINTVRANIAKVAPNARVIDGASPIKVDNPGIIAGKRVLVVEDGPTLTHGHMKIGAGAVAAMRYGAASMVDARPYAVGRIGETYKIYPEIGQVLPAMGYGEQQLKDLETTINNTECDAVLVATPMDLNRIIKIKHPNTRVYYDLQEIGEPTVDTIIGDFCKKHNIGK